MSACICRKWRALDPWEGQRKRLRRERDRKKRQKCCLRSTSINYVCKVTTLQVPCIKQDPSTASNICHCTLLLILNIFAIPGLSQFLLEKHQSQVTRIFQIKADTCWQTCARILGTETLTCNTPRMAYFPELCNHFVLGTDANWGLGWGHKTLSLGREWRTTSTGSLQ